MAVKIKNTQDIARSDDRADLASRRAATAADRLISLVTALAVATVAAIAAVISYRHAYELVSAHGEAGLTARLVPLTVDGLIVAASMLILDAGRRNQPVPALAHWCLGTSIMATIGANLAHGLGNGPIGALISAWPALALAGSFELLMTLVRTGRREAGTPAAPTTVPSRVPVSAHDVQSAPAGVPSLADAVQTWHAAGPQPTFHRARTLAWTAGKSSGCWR